MLTVDQTVRTYSGKRGCMCGCQGTYNDSIKARKLAITQMLKHPKVWLESWDSKDVDKGCLVVESDTRQRVLYLTQEGVDAVRAMGVAQAF